MSSSTDKKTANDAQPAGGGRERFTAFMVDEESEQIIKQSIIEMQLSYSTVYRGGISKAIAHLKQQRSPMALMVDISGMEFPINQIHELAEVCEPGVDVLVCGDRNDVGLYRDLLHAGVADYIVKPLTRPLVQSRLNVLLGLTKTEPRSSLSQKLGQVTAILGARGGVGTTTVASNLAWYLANKESRRVCLVDLDLFFGNCALMLDLKPGSGLREVLENPKRVDDLFLARTMLVVNDRLHVLASEERLDVQIRPDPNALEPLFALLRQKYHYIIVDVPRRSNAFLRDVMKVAGTSVLVMDQTAHALRDAIRLRQFLMPDDVKTHRSISVLNRVGESGSEAISVKDLSETLGVAFQVTIPYVSKVVIASANAGIPVASKPGPLANSIGDLAKELSGRRDKVKRPWWKLGQ